jgi:hypothetical protein
VNKSSPRKRGSSSPLILKTLDSRFRGNDRLVQTFLNDFLCVLPAIAPCSV